MLKKIRFALPCFFLLCTANSWAIEKSLTPYITMEFEFPPNIAVNFSNAWLWTITATCTVHTKDETDDLIAKVTMKKIKINQQILSSNDAPLTVSMHSGDKLSISADAGAKASLVNHGENTLTAQCST